VLFFADMLHVVSVAGSSKSTETRKMWVVRSLEIGAPSPHAYRLCVLVSMLKLQLTLSAEQFLHVMQPISCCKLQCRSAASPLWMKALSVP